MRYLLILSLLVAPAVWADDVPDASVEQMDSGFIPAGPVLSMPSVTPPAGDNFGALDNPGVFFRGFYTSVRAGNYFEAAALLVIGLLALLRLFGKRLHEWLADDSLWDKPLWFLFDTKPGGILQLCLTTSAAGVGGAWLLGQHIDVDLVKPIVLTTFTASTLYGWSKDFIEWRKKVKADKAAKAGSNP